MRFELYASFCAFLLLGVGGCVAEEKAPLPHFRAEYVDALRVDRYEITERGANYTYLYPRHRIDGQVFPPDESDIGGGATIAVCSDERFKCITFESLAMAVPRAGLKAEASYTVAGAKLKVVKCYRGKGDVCQVALIESDCYISGYATGCLPDPAKAPRGGGHWERLYFLYNEDFGVTSFGFSLEKSFTDAQIDALARNYILVGDTGLLKE